MFTGSLLVVEEVVAQSCHTKSCPPARCRPLMLYCRWQKKRTKGQKKQTCRKPRAQDEPCHIPSHVFHLDMHKTSRPQCLDETWPPCVLEYRILRFTWEVARPCAQSKLHTSRAMCSPVLTAPALDHSCPSCNSCTSPPSTCEP